MTHKKHDPRELENVKRCPGCRAIPVNGVCKNCDELNADDDGTEWDDFNPLHPDNKPLQFSSSRRRA